MNITWYEDENLTITFTDTPHVAVRTVLPSMTDKEIKAIKKKPFINKRELGVCIFDHIKGKKYKFAIEKDFCWNGSDIPRIFWRLVGSKSNPDYLVASCIHDFLLYSDKKRDNKKLINYDRRLSSMVFKGCLIEAGVGKIKANIMAEAVDAFQRLCNWREK